MKSIEDDGEGSPLSGDEPEDLGDDTFGYAEPLAPGSDAGFPEERTYAACWSHIRARQVFLSHRLALRRWKRYHAEGPQSGSRPGDAGDSPWVTDS